MTPAADLARQRTHALAMLLIANFFWGASFPLMKAVSLTHAGLDPAAGGWFITAMTVGPRFALAAAALGLWLAWRGAQARAGARRAAGVIHAGGPGGGAAGGGVAPAATRPGGRAPAGAAPTRREWAQGIGLGLFAAGGMLLQADGLQHTAASTSAFLTQLYAVMIPLWVAVRARRGPPPVVWTAVGLVAAGTAVLARLDFGDLRLGRGELETLLGSFFFMGQILLLERRDCGANRPLVITLIMFVVETAVFAALALGLAPGAGLEALLTPWTSGAWLGFTVALTVACTLVAFILMNTFQPRITATEAGLIYCVEPIFGSVMALFLPALFSVWAGIAYANEELSWTLLLGGGLITAANVLITLKPPPR